MQVHLVDGTYELFRHHFAVPSHVDGDGMEVAAVRGVVGTVLGMLEQGATHLGVATDHVIESFRNDLWIDYKTGAGVPEELLAQFPLLEEALRALGVAVWPMVELEADDGLASAAAVASTDPRVDKVYVCTPDKDLAQCVVDPTPDHPPVVMLDRRKEGTELDEEGVRGRFGVSPSSIPDYLALVGDSADGFPGLPGWGAKSAAAVLTRYEHVESIPDDPAEWDVTVRGAARLASTLAAARPAAALFKDLATLRTTGDVGTVDDWEWRGALPELRTWAERLGAAGLVARAERLAAKRTPSC